MDTRGRKERLNRSKHLVPQFKDVSSDSYQGSSHNKWIIRNHDIPFNCNGVYHGIVETIQSRHAATVVIGQRERGIPLLWHENWGGKNVHFAKVLLLVERLRPSINEPEYGKDTLMYERVQEGEVLMVVVQDSRKTSDNMYKYFASSAHKMESPGKIMDSFSMLSIRDPLRGIMEYIVAKDTGVIRFGTYNGHVAEAVCSSTSFYKNGERMKENVRVSSIAPVDSLVFLEVVKWHEKARTQEWEKLLFRKGVNFKASMVWLKDDTRPTYRNGNSVTRVSGNHFEDSKMRGFKNFPDDNKLLSDSIAGKHQSPSNSLTSINAYYGVVETLAGSFGAIVCTAHRSGEPLTWEDSWFAHGVSLERVLLLSEHVRLSKTATECARGTYIGKILGVGDKVMLVVEPTAKRPEKCYKWFAKTSWKVDSQKDATNFPVSLLSGHLSGSVDCMISHDIGVICFRTYHGHLAKAFFNHGSIYINGDKVLPHIPLASEVKNGTKVHLVVQSWNPGDNPNENDLILLQNKVTFRAIIVWEFGVPLPSERECMGNLITFGSTDDLSALESHPKHFGIEKKGKHERDQLPPTQRAAATINMFGNEKKNFFGNRKGKLGTKATARGRYSKQNKTARNFRDNSDCVSNCTDFSESNLSDVSNLNDFLGGMAMSMENLALEESNQSFLMDSSRMCKKAEHKPKRGEINERSKKEKYSSSTVPYGQSSVDISTNPFKGVKIPDFDSTFSGTLVSVDETWGLIQVQGHEVHDFQSNLVFFYGLKLENIPLQRLFYQGQSFKVHMEKGKVTALEYGTPQLPKQMRKAVLTYCENNSVPHSVKDLLESCMIKYGV